MLGGRDERRGLEGILEPLEQVAIGEQVHAEKGGESGPGPASTREIVEPLEDQEGQEGRPDLNPQGVLGRSDEGLHLQVLFQGLEEELDLPAVTVDRRDRRGAEVEVIPSGRRSPAPSPRPRPRHGEEERAASCRRRGSRVRRPRPTGQDVPVLGNGLLLDDGVGGALLNPGHEEDAFRSPALEEGIVVVAAIHDDDRAGAQRDPSGGPYVAAPGLGHQDVLGKVVVVAQQDVELDHALGPAVAGPREELQAEGDARRVQEEQLVLEPEGLVLAQACRPSVTSRPSSRRVMLLSKSSDFGPAMSGGPDSPSDTALQP